MLAGGFAELLSLGAVLPFIAVLANPEATARHPAVAVLMERFDISLLALPVAIGLIFAVAFVLATLVRLLLIWANIRFANGLGAEIGEALYTRTLHRPYAFHVSRNTSEIIGSMNKVQKLVVGFVQPILTGLSAAVLSIAIVGLLIAVNPGIALGGAALFGGSYFLIALIVRRRLAANGIVIAKASDQRIQAMQEGLGGIRDVILDHAQAIYGKRYSRIEQSFRRAQASSQFDGMFPRVAVEAIGILLLVGFAAIYTRTGGNIMMMLPVVGLLAMGAQRLIPLMQQVYAGWVAAVNNEQSLEDVLSLLEFQPAGESSATVEFESAISLTDVSFSYESSGRTTVLSGINLRISRGEKIGIAGPTGSGKSTLVDVLMGLLLPSSGQFMVDNCRITAATASAWQRNVSHVPQAIYLSDATIAENIAFGVEAGKIDRPRMENAARAAQIHDHVATLPKGYDTTVGERGVRLSGGQRQRIGIARALYKGAPVLVLDEATSALDDETERKVMAGILDSTAATTLIMIAHRLTTMRDCDRIIELRHGRIERCVDYADLMRVDDGFGNGHA